ncbi:MAG: PEP-CTERM sorting domain-containing protein [Planctomycetota bacterium]
MQPTDGQQQAILLSNGVSDLQLGQFFGRPIGSRLTGLPPGFNVDPLGGSALRLDTFVDAGQTLTFDATYASNRVNPGFIFVYVDYLARSQDPTNSIFGRTEFLVGEPNLPPPGGGFVLETTDTVTFSQTFDFAGALTLGVGIIRGNSTVGGRVAFFDNFQLSQAVIPEPSTLVAICLGGAAVGLARRRH